MDYGTFDLNRVRYTSNRVTPVGCGCSIDKPTNELPVGQSPRSIPIVSGSVSSSVYGEATIMSKRDPCAEKELYLAGHLGRCDDASDSSGAFGVAVWWLTRVGMPLLIGVAILSSFLW